MVGADHARERRVHRDDMVRRIDDDDAVRGMLEEGVKVGNGHECRRRGEASVL